jgi:6-pyruvoyltetrahydropterin/6-carboxytetrahydropterin synthase
LTAKFWFSASHLDQNNWVVDFGGLKGLKKLMQNQFDHTTCISRTDPKLDVFNKLRDAGVCDLRVMDGVGIEKFAEYCHTVAEAYVDELTDGRCNCTKVEVFEHESNSAIFEKQSSEHTGAEFMKNKADEIAASHNDAPERADDTLTRPPFPKKEEQRQTDEAIQNLRDIPMPLSSNDSKIKNKWIDGKSTNVWGI